jgi:UDP-N-acetylmuramate dehydrogenase
VRLDKYTTLRVGGPADYFCEPETEEALAGLLAAAETLSLPVLLMGNGSNLLVRDGGFRGLAIRLGRGLSRIERTEGGLRAGAGALLSVLSRTAQEAALTGLEFAQGIPGTVGGGVYMNAGAYGGEMKQIVRNVRVLAGENVLEIDGESMDFSYRHSRAMEEGWMILGAEFSLAPGNRDDIDAAMRDYAARRKEKQPLEYPSAGSFFKRPQGHFAGALIEQAGLKGCAVGGAQVSQKHAGFLINRGGATAEDFLRLMARVQDTVEARFGVRLEPEVRIVGSEG